MKHLLEGLFTLSNTLNLNKCVVDGQWENWRSCRLFRHSAPLSTHSENRSRLGWTIIISYKSLCFVNPSLESVRLFQGLHDFHIAFNTPCLPYKILLKHCLPFLLGWFNTQEKLETMVLQNLGGGGGGIRGVLWAMWKWWSGNGPSNGKLFKSWIMLFTR